MKIEMIYHTPDYHKLVEAIARVCYQSYDKLSETSHGMIRGIMKKGHLSIASSGNMVFKIDMSGADMEDIITISNSLLTFKEINNFIRWTIPSYKGSKGSTILVSMNLLTLLDLVNNIKNYSGAYVLNLFLAEVKKFPYLSWFLDNSIEVPPSNSPYIGNPTLGNPVILSEDYTSLKALGLTDHELDIHATVTVDLITDRASGLQLWRHGDMTGGCELSQRYCDRSNAVLRHMEGIHNYPEKLVEYAKENEISIDEAKEHYGAVITSLINQYHNSVNFYSDVKETLKELGVSGKRSKEIARSVLPNAMTTRIIQCRPLRQWKHLFELRDSVHAQAEIRRDVQAIKREFDKAGVKYD